MQLEGDNHCRADVFLLAQTEQILDQIRYDIYDYLTAHPCTILIANNAEHYYDPENNSMYWKT